MISTADLQDWMKAADADAPTLRALEEACVKALQNATGRYLGVTATITDIIRFRGFPLQLTNDPVGGTITSLEQWDGTTWTTVTTDTYYLWNSFIFSVGQWRTLSLTLFRATYTAGYTVDPTDADVWAAPADIQLAVKLLVGHFFENREAVIAGTTAVEVPLNILLLVSPNARVAV